MSGVCGPIDWEATGSMLTGIGTCGLAIITLVGGFFAWRTFKEAARATARSSYSEYAVAAVKYPEFNFPNLENLAKEEKLSQYEWFVFLMLQACEEIMVALKGEDDWLNTIKFNAQVHEKYLRSQRFEYLRQFFKKELVAEIDKALKGKPTLKPATINDFEVVPHA